MTTVTRFRARLPQDANGPAIPVILIQEATEFDYQNAHWEDGDCSSMQTSIYYWSGAGMMAAERIVADLKACGVALVYPFDRDLRIYVGSKHHVVQLGACVPLETDGGDE